MNLIVCDKTDIKFHYMKLKKSIKSILQPVRLLTTCWGKQNTYIISTCVKFMSTQQDHHFTQQLHVTSISSHRLSWHPLMIKVFFLMLVCVSRFPTFITRNFSCYFLDFFSFFFLSSFLLSFLFHFLIIFFT